MVDESIGVSNASASAAYAFSAIYPAGHTPPADCQHRGSVTVTVGASDVLVLQLKKAPSRQQGRNIPSFLRGGRPGATLTHSEGIVSIEGMVGGTGSAMEVEIATAGEVKQVVLNNHTCRHTITPSGTVLVASVRFAGQRLGRWVVPKNVYRCVDAADLAAAG